MEVIARIAPETWRHAVDTFGTEESALCWMRQPLAELGERTPERVLLEESQGDAVEAILARIDYGLYDLCVSIPTLSLFIPMWV